MSRGALSSVKVPPGFEERWRRRFESFGAEGEGDAEIAGWSESGLDTRLRNFARLWGARRPDARWLDVGCGAGTYTRLLADSGVEPIGMDYSLPSLLKARARSPHVRGWCLGDVNRLPVRSGSLDGVLCFGVLQALERSDRAMAELVRVVRPGGEVWLDALNAGSLPNLVAAARRRLRKAPLHLRFESAAQLAEMMRTLGLQAVRTHWVPIAPPAAPGLQTLLESPAVRALLVHVPSLGLLASHAVLLHGTKRGEIG